jgi:hypothetical protein
MKVRSLFDLVIDARDVVEFFDRVETVDQMVSKLERIKRNDAEDFLACIDALRTSISDTLDDTLEMSADLSEGEENEEIPELSELEGGSDEEAESDLEMNESNDNSGDEISEEKEENPVS